MLLAAWWLVLGMGALWRRTIWSEAGEHLRATAAALDGELRPRWNGYEVQGRGRQVRWTGGLRGARTLVKGPHGHRTEPGWRAVADS